MTLGSSTRPTRCRGAAVACWWDKVWAASNRCVGRRERRAGSVTLLGKRLDDATASGRGARVPTAQSANCWLVCLRAASASHSQSYNQGLTRVITTSLYLLFLDLAGTGGPLRFFDVEASFAARCACLKRSMLALLCTL